MLDHQVGHRPPPVLAVLRRLAGDEGGNVLVVVALAAIPLVGAVGLAIDAGRAFIVQDQLQKALDAAGLAAGHAADQTTAKADAQNFFAANFNAAAGATSNGLTVTFSSDGLTVTLTASASQPTTFMQVLGIKSVTVSGQAVIKRQVTGLELALVLDNTGSMVDEDKIGSLKTAAHELLDALYGTNDTIPNLWVSVVPFIAAVNVGAANAAFLKSGDQALGTASAFSPDKWGGCVLARYGTGSYDRTDDPPSVAKFSSYLYPKVTSGPSSAWVNNVSLPRWRGRGRKVGHAALAICS
jgi:Flp pilus assembly protein TadG